MNNPNEEMLSRARQETPKTGESLITEKVWEVTAIHYKSLESYIKKYLRLTQSKIEDLELCEERTFVDNKIVTKYWLQPRKEVSKL